MGRSPTPVLRKREKERCERRKRRERRSRERERDRERDRPVTSTSGKSHGHRSARQRSRERERNRSRSVNRSTRRRSRSKSATHSKDCTYPSTSTRSKADRPKVTEADLEGKSPEEVDMLKTMGFCSFDTTKHKKVDGNDVGEVHVILKRKYRQYMNRKGGFNRPLDFVA